MTDDMTDVCTQELIRSTTDIGDLLGTCLVLTKVVGARHLAGLSHIKILVGGLGWASAEFALTRALPLWVGARGTQFDWKYIMMSIDANFNLVMTLFNYN